MSKFFLYEGNAYDILDRLAPRSVDVCYTSPSPAFFELNKGVRGDWVVCAEENTDLYRMHLMAIIEKVGRVLKTYP